ncbi:MAG: ATPase, T2SS/T4P/T4SS family [Elusimicrobiaceae bacterium]|nr:ATPase, T2SS/T4P/T4SS family [Elusimicrobiaceae bacterium]
MTETAQKTILIIDDDQDILELVRLFLGKENYRVITMSGPEGALEKVRAVVPDLILLDIMMPGTNGYNVCADIQKNSGLADIPVVFISALSGEEDRARAFTVGGVGYLPKPITKKKLLEAVSYHIKKAEEWQKIAKSSVDQKRQDATKRLATDFVSFKDFLIDRFGVTDSQAGQILPLRWDEVYSISLITHNDERAISRAMADYTGYEYIPIINPDDIKLGMLPISFCRSNSVLIISEGVKDDDDEELVSAAISNPFNTELTELLRSNISSLSRILVTEPENIRSLLNLDSGEVSSNLTIESAKAASHIVTGGNPEDIEKKPVLYISDRILESAVKERASDIHIEPKETSVTVRFRVDGDLHDFFKLKPMTGAMVVSRFKALSGMDISDRRRPQDGSFKIIVEHREYILRLATTSTLFGESLVVRVVEPGAKAVSLIERGMNLRQEQDLMELARRNSGLIMMVGPTGSGKTTTIFSLLANMDTQSRSLISVEDPIEYRIPNAKQHQVNEKAGVTFEALLKSSVRQDPDILFIGEIRDKASAKIAIDFASTAHLAISTIHTPNATSAIFRLERLGIERDVLSVTIIGIVAQRLLKRLCPHCRKLKPMSSEQISFLKLFSDKEITESAHPVGCYRCNNTGYLGRMGVFEIIKFDPDITEMIRNGVTISELRRIIGQQRKYQLIGESAIEKLQNFECSFQQVYDKILVEEIIYQPAVSPVEGLASLEPEQLDYEGYSPPEEGLAAPDPGVVIQKVLSNKGGVPARRQDAPAAPQSDEKPAPEKAGAPQSDPLPVQRQQEADGNAAGAQAVPAADTPFAPPSAVPPAAQAPVAATPVVLPGPLASPIKVPEFAAPVTIVGQDQMTFAPARKYVEPGGGGNSEARKPSVLFVDDDPDMRLLIGRILQNNGYAVTASTDGADALFHIAKENFDLIIADIEMPTLNGLAFASIIQDKGIRVPLIFLTSHNRQESESKAFSLGAEDFIQKPVQKEVFLMRIARALRRRVEA